MVCFSNDLGDKYVCVTQETSGSCKVGFMDQTRLRQQGFQWCQNMTCLVGLSPTWPQISFHEEYQGQTEILICDKQLHEVICYGKIQNNSAPAHFFNFFITTISNYRHETQVMSGLHFLLRK